MIESSPTSFLSFQLEKWSRRFYHSFKAEYAAFLQQLTIRSPSMTLHSYGYLLIQRILVLFFLQAQGLLDQDSHYLQHHLQHYIDAADQPGDGFYHQCFLPLCALLYTGEASGAYAHTRLGYVPHLAHPLFQPLPQEQMPHSCSVPDIVFKRLFTFLHTFTWQLTPYHYDATALISTSTPVLTPHVLAYLYEQYSDQKQTGTYYTQSDIALYISSQTIISALLTRISAVLPSLLSESAPCWQLLQLHPERYLPPALCSPDRLPEESAYEYSERQTHLQQCMTRMQAGDCHDIAALTTYNLDAMRFAYDFIAQINDVSWLIAILQQLQGLSILDPTCGSGAFLTASIMVLYPLYMLCLQRLYENSVALQNIPSASQSHQQDLYHRYQPTRQPDWQPTWQPTWQAASLQGAYILQTIVSQNLYGVDLQLQTVNLCRLLLYLQILGEHARIQDVPPFSSLSMHIYCGDALTPLTIPSPKKEFLKKENSTIHKGKGSTIFQWQMAFPAIYRDGGFAVILGNPPYLEYSKIKQRKPGTSDDEKICGNIYATIIKRSLELCQREGSYLGLIAPISLCSSARFQTLRQYLLTRTNALWLANFEIFPCRLFEHGFQRVSILIARTSSHASSRQTADIAPAQLFVTRIHRWYTAERAHLLHLLTYTRVTILHTHTPLTTNHSEQTIFPRLASPLQEQVITRWRHCAGPYRLADMIQKQPGPFFVYYQEATNYWTKAVCHIPYYKKDGIIMRPPHGRCLYFAQEQQALIVMALLNSSLFYLWFATYADGFHLSHSLVQNFPFPPALASSPELYRLAQYLEKDIQRNIQISTRNTRSTATHPHTIELAEYYMRYSKPILDKVDHWLARYCSHSAAEEHFITHYDLKYRMAKITAHDEIEQQIQ